MADPITVVYLEHHPILRNAIVRLLVESDGIELIGHTGNVTEAIDITVTYRPDIFLASVDSPGGDTGGLVAISDPAIVQSGAKLVIFSGISDQQQIRHTVTKNIRGYLSKTQQPESFIGSLRVIADGGYVFHQSARSRFIIASDPAHAEAEVLTSSEQKVLQLVTDGKRNQDIARELSMSIGAIRQHLSSIFEKMHVSNRTSAVVTGISRGLVE